MRVLVAPDDYKGTLSAVEAVEAIAAGWRDAAPDTELDLAPLSDGGPGFLAVLHASLGGELVEMEVSGPLGGRVRAQLLEGGATAYVESAQACGLHLVVAADRDPARADTAGVGELVAAAARRGARRVVVGLGGSGSNDGGSGALRGLGWRLLDIAGAPLPRGGAALAGLARLEAAAPLGVDLLVATDVDNPLLGPDGATAVYGLQKGLPEEQVPVLDAALARLADVAARDVPGAAGRAAMPGAGAAGGLAYGLLLAGGCRVSGIALVREVVRLDARAAVADLVVTGEGSFDAQSLRGKAVTGVAEAAALAGVPCIVLAGQVHVGRREAGAAGVTAAYATGVAPVDGRRAAAALRGLAAEAARRWCR